MHATNVVPQGSILFIVIIGFQAWKMIKYCFNSSD